MLQLNASVVAELKNRNAFVEMYGHTARIILFPMQLDKKFHQVPLHWKTCFSLFVFLKVCFFQTAH